MSSPTTRYLVFFQYWGTKYSGVMKTLSDQPVLGVQNYLEAAQRLRPVAPVKFFISSRTDTGVHALCNAAHFDIQRAAGKPPFPESVLVSALNYHLKAEPICILSAYQVSSNFHARFSALSRTYVYRLVTGCSHHSEIPVFERDLCWALSEDHLNVPAMQEAAGLLLGTHDFSTFRSVSTDMPFKSPLKTLDQAEIRPSSGFMSHHYEYRGLQFWELEFKSRSFLYRQVRRMVGALVAVGRGRLAPHHIKELLEIRDPLAYPLSTMAPAAGLFLKSVEYAKVGERTYGVPVKGNTKHRKTPSQASDPPLKAAGTFPSLAIKHLTGHLQPLSSKRPRHNGHSLQSDVVDGALSCSISSFGKTFLIMLAKGFEVPGRKMPYQYK